MEAIVSMLESIGNFIASIVDVVLGLIQDILYIIEITAQTVASIPTYFTWMPSASLSLLVTIFGVVVVYKVLGREG